jgi:hypothetical protein
MGVGAGLLSEKGRAAQTILKGGMGRAAILPASYENLLREQLVEGLDGKKPQGRLSLMYNVWEAQNNGDDDTYLVAMSECREMSVREEIATGKRQMRLLRLRLFTDDRNFARNVADCEI